MFQKCITAGNNRLKKIEIQSLAFRLVVQNDLHEYSWIVIHHINSLLTFLVDEQFLSSSSLFSFSVMSNLALEVFVLFMLFLLN